MSVSAALKARVRRPSYLKKIAEAEDLIHHFPNDAYIGEQSHHTHNIRRRLL